MNNISIAEYEKDINNISKMEKVLRALKRKYGKMFSFRRGGFVIIANRIYGNENTALYDMLTKKFEDVAKSFGIGIEVLWIDSI